MPTKNYSVFQLLKEEPERFYKKLFVPFYTRSDAFSIIIPNLEKHGEYKWARMMKEFSKWPEEVNELAQIFMVLKKEFPDQYGVESRETIYDAIAIYEKHIEAIREYLSRRYQKKGPILTTMTPEEAFKEFVARGFIFSQLVPGLKDNVGWWYVKGNVGSLVYPKLYPTQEQARKCQKRRGIMGYTGYSQIL